MNLSIGGEKKEVKVDTCMSEKVRDELVTLLRDYQDIFTWTYQDMPSLSSEIMQHKLPLNPKCSPVKQKLRIMKPEMSLKIKEEVKKQFDAGFLAAAWYPQWVANIMPFLKKDGKVRMCVNYRDLNRANPKDNFPLPHIDVLVDNTTSFALFSFMDGFSGYNQIKMASEDMEKTTYITLWGTLCYKVMSFGMNSQMRILWPCLKRRLKMCVEASFMMMNQVVLMMTKMMTKSPKNGFKIESTSSRSSKILPRLKLWS